MTTSRTKLTYYNGIMWRSVLLADGTQVVQPFRVDGGAATALATARHYRRPALVHG